MTNGRPKVVFVYADRVAREMGGMGIRALELARALSPDADVSIAASESDGTDLGVPVSTFDPHAPQALRDQLRGADTVVAQPQWPLAMRILGEADAQLIFDLYDPEVFGTLEHFKGRRPALRRQMSAFAADRVDQALRLADRVICASERQRDLWLGAMMSTGRLDAVAYSHDHTLRSVIDIVPFGVPEEPPERGSTPGPSELLGIGKDDELVLWNGGIWSWLDAPGAIRAIGRVRSARPNARLVFMGSSRSAAARSATAQAVELARELDLLGTGVLFHDGWVPYRERATWLLEADCAISAHLDHLEARYAHRTRMLDCFWAGLPIVCTSGDELADEVDRSDLGATAAPGDDGGLAAGLERVLARGRDDYAAGLAGAAGERTWARAAGALKSWINEPPPPRPRRTAGRPAGERTRTATYVAAASVASALRIPAPRLQ